MRAGWAFRAFLLLVAFLISPSCVRGQILGVQDIHSAHFSEAASSNEFRCLDGSLTLPIEKVNDNICDCSDGSDEPGTSACALFNGTSLVVLPSLWKFKCQDSSFSQEVPHFVVNDGICDCCDGSDEYQTPVVCPNTCEQKNQKEKMEAEEKRRIKEIIHSEKEKMIAAARASKPIQKHSCEGKRCDVETPSTKDLLAGLTGSKFTLTTQEYVYELDMFSKIQQDHILLGTWGSFGMNSYSKWSNDQTDYSTMLYKDGTHCWNGAARSVEVNGVCGPYNNLTGVEEPEVGFYKMTFASPAFCEDNQY